MAQSFVGAEPVDPRHLPVPLRTLRRTALVSVSHAWVLHRRLVVRVAGAILALLLIVGAYEARGLLALGANAVVKMVQGEFVAAGFGINQITISGQALTRDSDIVALMTMSAGSSTLDFDVGKARARLEWLRAVESATVRKVYPNQIIVEIVEKEPVARWRSGNATWLVDQRGAIIGEDPAGAFAELPMVVGEGAADDALVMIRALDQHAALTRDLAVLSRIGDRRWDLIYYSGLRVKLPERGVAQALDQLEAYQADYALLDRDVNVIDLRVPGIVALKPAVREDAGSGAEKQRP
ncbi:cell division protein FtsQ/DivIB [Devosia sp.]|uniref:cell division protein FtsQ/DivIB n=1 Tax=Devosia sp. TaxID=1871048 RepID=UPI002F1157EC